MWQIIAFILVRGNGKKNILTRTEFMLGSL